MDLKAIPCGSTEMEQERNRRVTAAGRIGCSVVDRANRRSVAGRIVRGTKGGVFQTGLLASWIRRMRMTVFLTSQTGGIDTTGILAISGRSRLSTYRLTNRVAG